MNAAQINAIHSSQVRDYEFCENGRFLFELVRRRLKNGKLSWHFDREQRKYSPLLTCEICDRLGTNAPCKSQVRHVFFYKDPEALARRVSPCSAQHYSYLCFGCESKVRALHQRFAVADRLRKDINKFKGMINESPKNNA